MLTTEKLTKALERLLEGLERDIEEVFGEDVTVHEVAVRAATDKVLAFVNENMTHVPRVEGTLTDIVSDVLARYSGESVCPQADRVVPLVAKRRLCRLGGIDSECSGTIDDVDYDVTQNLYLDEYGNFVRMVDVAHAAGGTRQTIHTVTDWNAEPIGVPTALFDVLDEDTRDVFFG